MSEIDLTINGRAYTIACDDGQEEHLQLLASHIDEKVGELAQSVGQIGESRLLVMASLLIADELSDAYTRLAKEQEGGSANGGPVGFGAQGAVEAMEKCAQRIESLAAEVEHA